MRPLQRFLLCLLCAALPLRGGAGMPAAPAPCPMSPAMALATEATGPDACCEHGDQAGEAGTMCKAMQDCDCSAPGIPVHCTVAVHGPRPALLPLPTRLRVAACHPSAVWRPPTSL